MKWIHIAASSMLLAGICGAAQAFTPWDMPFFGDRWFNNDTRSDRFQIMAPDLYINRMEILPSDTPGATGQEQTSWKLFVRVRNKGAAASPRTSLRIYHSRAEQGGEQRFDMMSASNREVRPLGPRAYQDFYIPIPGEHGVMGQWTGMYLAIVDPPDRGQWFGKVQELPWPRAEANNARMLQGTFTPRSNSRSSETWRSAPGAPRSGIRDSRLPPAIE